MRPSMYRPSSHFRDYTQPNKELDLREWFDNIMFGNENGDLPHAHLILHRKMRRDSNGQRIPCTCFSNEGTTEPNYSCSYCSGEGFLWDEKWLYAYSMHAVADSSMVKKYIHVAPGQERTDYLVFYLRYDTDIRYGDKLVEVSLDSEGKPVSPLVREAVYKPHTIVKHRADFGRIEFIPVFCREEDAWRSDEF